MSVAIQEALAEEMDRDPSVFLLGEEIGVWGGAYNVTGGLLERYGPMRVFDTPISEAAIAGAAVGAALTGCRPVAEFMFSDFMGIAMDQIANQAAKNRYMFGGKAKLPIVYRAPFGAVGGNAAQHSQSPEAWFTHVPGLKVVTSSTPYDAKGLLKSAIRDDNVVIFFEHKALYAVRGHVPTGEYTIPLGVADVKRTGTDVSVMTYARQVQYALEAAEALAAEGISVEVVDLRTLYPLDIATVLASVRKTHRAVVVHESVKFGG
ncbi:MAG: alpha-ketoacid dehydrogenase subunit beta, partial [Actinobacteria bacterium]|nr:alpha-ketoacid dehydrogenase subunit beta [Actinomycetota bacterium]